MIFVKICVGSSCHLKGSQKLVESFQKAISEGGFDNMIVLSGSFCLGKCNREGVTVTVGNENEEQIYCGVKPEDFQSFWTQSVISKL